jgi:AcrR family transcriptional regulator
MGIQCIAMTEKATVERIADAALSILEAKGPQGVTMRRVAEAVGITPMAIYHHFPNREALLDSITDREFAKFLGYIERRSAPGSPEEQVLGPLEAYIDYAFDRPRIFDYVFSQTRPAARRYPEDFQARRSPTLNPLADRVAEAMADGWMKEDDVWEVALELWAVTHGYVALYRAGRFSLDEREFRALVQRALRRVVCGLRA